MAIISTSDGKFGILSNQGFRAVGTSSVGFTDLARSSQGQLFGISAFNLYRLNLRTGASSFVGSHGSAGMNGLAFDNLGKLYGTNGSSFYRLSLTTGAATRIASIRGFASSGDLVFMPDRNAFYATSATTGDDVLFRINRRGQATRIGRVGFTDVFGLTVENGTLVGYTDSSLKIRINVTTGKGTFLKDFNLTSRIYGAT